MTKRLPANKILAALMLVLMATAPAAQAQAYEHQSLYVLVQHAIDNHIVPRFKEFQTAAENLARDTSAFCAGPTDAGRNKLRDSFKATALAWAAVDYLRMGPASDGGRHERIAFWPDPRSVMERQLRPLLANRDQSFLGPDALAQQSASVQGLPALEWLFADDTFPIGADSDDGRYRCALSVAIAANVASIATEIVTGWTRQNGWRDRMLRPGSDNPSYHSASESAGEIAKSLLTGLQLMLEAQVKPRLEPPKEGRAKSTGLPYRKLHLSEAYLLAGLKSAQALYDVAAFASYLPAEKDNFRQLIGGGFETIIRQVSAAAANADKHASEPKIEAWKPVASMLGGVRRAIAVEVLPAAEISLGFNELDGD